MTLFAQDKKWHALYVSSRTEKKVAETLLLKGIEAYVPLMKTMRQWSDRKKMVELSLINGYVFVRLSPAQHDLALQTRHVVNFVRMNGKNAVVRDEEIERLKQLIEVGYHLEVVTAKHSYAEGDKVKIMTGALKNIEGFVVRQEEGRYIDVLLDSIGQSIRVKLPEDILVPA